MINLNIGCGTTIKEGYDGVDIVDFGQKYVLDVRNGLSFENESVDNIYTSNFMEHLTNDEAIKVLNEFWRIIKPNCELFIIVPNATLNGGAFILEHKSYWSEQTFTDLNHARCWPVYGIKCWDINSIVSNNHNDIHCRLIKSEGK